MVAIFFEELWVQNHCNALGCRVPFPRRSRTRWKSTTGHRSDTPFEVSLDDEAQSRVGHATRPYTNGPSRLVGRHACGHVAILSGVGGGGRGQAQSRVDGTLHLGLAPLGSGGGPALSHPAHTSTHSGHRAQAAASRPVKSEHRSPQSREVGGSDRAAARKGRAQQTEGCVKG